MKWSKMFFVMLAVVGMTFFMSCGDDKYYDDTYELPEADAGDVTAGEITDSLYINMKNAVVTEENFHEFYNDFSGEMPSVYSMMNEMLMIGDIYDIPSMENYNNYLFDTIVGSKLGDGHAGFMETIIVTSNKVNQYDYMTTNIVDMYKLFDYSNSGQMFLGGAIGQAIVVGAKDDNSSYIPVALKSNIKGTVEFRGKFRGSITFDDVHNSISVESNGVNSRTGSVIIRSGDGEFVAPM